MISRGKRYRKVLAVLARHGFGDLSRGLGARLLFRKKSQESAAKRWVNFRKALEELGPTYVKFGQVLSNRPGILPDELTQELARLQDQVPPFGYDEVQSIFQASFGQAPEHLFKHFDPTPVASASIAQVHKAVLHSGETVAVKIRRPNIEPIIRADVAIMHDIARLMMRNEELASLQPIELVKAFEQTILAELDFELEFKNIRKFYELFEGDANVRIPKPYPEFSRDTLLTLEYLDGIKISRKEALSEAGYDLQLIARRGFDAFFRQIFEWGYFHADPHPGNLLVLPGNVIGILDFGMVGQLSPNDRNALVEFVIALGRDDVSRIVENIEKLQGSPVADRGALERDLATFISEFGSKAVKEIDLNDALDKGRKMAYKHKLRLNPDLFLLFRTISLLEGIGISLDPQFRSLDIIRPYAYTLLRKKLNPKNILQSKALLAWLADWYQIVTVLPGDVRKILTKIKDDQLVIKTEQPAIDRLSAQIGRTGRDISKTLLAITFLVLATIAHEKHMGTVVWAGFNLATLVFGGLASVLLLNLFWRWRRAG